MSKFVRGFILLWFSFFGNAVFLELIIYWKLMTASDGQNVFHNAEPSFFVSMALLILLMWLIMAFLFILDKSLLIKVKDGLMHYFRRAVEEILGTIMKILMWVIPIAVILLAFALSLDYIYEMISSNIVEIGCLAALYLILGFIILLLSAVIRAMGDLSEDLIEVMGNWAWSIRLSSVYFVCLFLAAWLYIKPASIQNADLRLNFLLFFSKDTLLLFIIIFVLYIGVYKLRMANCLRRVFISVDGFLSFLIMCALIAIMAVWADFTFPEQVFRELEYAEPWMEEYTRNHVYLRDIALLIFPISTLFMWAVFGIIEETKADTRVITRKP